MFAWLFFSDRLNTRANLFSKHIIESAACEWCPCTSEDLRHLFFNCSSSSQVWSILHLQRCITADRLSDLWTVQLPPCMQPHKKIWPSVLLAILWRIWDGRNKIIFDHQNFSVRRVISNAVDDLEVWYYRFHPRSSVVAWCTYFKNCISSM